MANPPACDATIAICTYNRIGTLPKTLQSLSGLRGPYTFEVVVVNGPSNDGTDAFLKTRKDIRVFENPEQNLAISRNIAIANARGRYISFIDDDAIPEPDWLTLVLDAFAHDDGLSAVGGFIRDANGIAFQAQYTFCDSFGRGYPCSNPDYAKIVGMFDGPVYPSLTGTNVTFRREDLLDIGGFDEVFAYFLDETDVNKRLADAGKRMLVVPEAEIHHKYAPSHLRTKDNLSRNMFPIARSIAYFTLRHGVPDRGWDAAIARIKAFYADEFGWKSDQFSQGKITKTEFEALIAQTAEGIRRGVDKYFDPIAPDATPALRVARHTRPSAPVVRKMTRPDGILRLCMLSQDHGHPQFGGIGRWSNLVARGLAEMGHEVTLLGDLHKHAGPEFCDFTQAGYWSHALSQFELGQALSVDCLGLPPALADASKRKLIEIQRIQTRRDFQLVSSPIWDVEGAAVIGSGLLPNVLSLHTCAGMMLSSKPEWREDQRYFQDQVMAVMTAERQALQRTRFLLANSEAVLKDISELYGLDLSSRPHAVVPHGIDDIANPKGLLQARQKARKANGTPLRILFLGRLERRKGVAHLVPVIDRLLEEGADIAVDIVGGRVDDMLFQMVMDLTAKHPDRVIWHGYMADDALDGLMRQADIFFAPSTYESFGLIYAEAMRYAIPSVGFATGGVIEVVTDGEDGVLAPLGDDEALYKALLGLIEHPTRLLRMSRAARRSFEDRFHYTLMAQRLAEVYQGVAQQVRVKPAGSAGQFRKSHLKKPLHCH